MMNRKLKTSIILLLYIGGTVGLYTLIGYFMKIQFEEIHFAYAALIGCLAYLPRFIAQQREKK